MKKYSLLLWIFTLFWLQGFVIAWPWCSIAPLCDGAFQKKDLLYPLEQYAFDAKYCQLSQWNTVIHAYLDTKKSRLMDNQSLALRDALNGMKNTVEKEMKQYYATIATWPLSLKQMQSFPKFKRWYILSYAVSYIDSAQKIWCYSDPTLQNTDDALKELLLLSKPVEQAQLFSSLVYVLPIYEQIYSWSTRLWWELNGFWIRFTARDIKNNAINPIVTITPPDWSCVHFYSGSLPMDFVEIKPVWWSRMHYNSRVTAQTPLRPITKDMHATYCGIERLKIVMPKEPNFFRKNAQGMRPSAPFGLWFTAPKNEVLPYPSCGEIVYSADNAQYSETNFCVQKQIMVKNYQYLQSIEDAIKDWLMTLQ